jgi:glycosyltransferase involved in cell wall biosynthesis
MTDQRLTSARPVRILYVAGGSDRTNVYGAERSVLDLVAGMDRTRFHACCAVAQGDGPYAGALRDLGIFVPRLWLEAGNGSGRSSTLAYARCARRLLRLARELQPDLIHVNSLKLNPYGILVGRALGVPVVCYLQGHVSLRAYCTRLAFAAQTIVACSGAVAAPWRRIPGADGRLRVVYYGIDPAPFTFSEERRRTERARLGLGDHTFAVGVVSRLSPSKKLETFFQAFKCARAKHRNLLAFIAGDAPPCWQEYGALVRQLPERMGIGPQVVFLGYVPHISSLYAAFDVVVAPSDQEGLGRVPLEAMAAARPVVAVRAGGPAETVLHGETGLLAEPGDPEAMASAISILAMNPPLCKEFGQAGRRWIEQKFDPASYVRAFEGIYDELLAGKREERCPASPS